MPGGTRSSVKTTLPADAHAYTLMPHAHLLLREMTLTATLPDGTVQPPALDRRLGLQLARPVPLRQARAAAEGDRARAGRHLRQLRRQPPQPQLAPPPRPVRPRQHRRDDRLPYPGDPRPARGLPGLPQEVAAGALIEGARNEDVTNLQRDQIEPWMKLERQGVGLIWSASSARSKGRPTRPSWRACGSD